MEGGRPHQGSNGGASGAGAAFVLLALTVVGLVGAGAVVVVNRTFFGRCDLGADVDLPPDRDLAVTVEPATGLEDGTPVVVSTADLAPGDRVTVATGLPGPEPVVPLTVAPRPR